jgi:hypothetical protein
MSDLPPTAPDPVPPSALRRSRAIRRAGLATLAVFVLLGAIGLFGIRTRTVTASAGGYTMSLDYPWTDRADQPIHWVLSIRRAGGFSGPVDIGITQSYLDLLDLNAIEPEPSGTHTDGPLVVWTFDPPSGRVLRVLVDANIQLNGRFGAAADVSVLEGGKPVVSVHYRTWVAP